MKKILALVLALAMILVCASALAAVQTVAKSPADADNASVTINNPAKGETYSIFKLFDATVSTSGDISYQGTVPSSLSAYFEADSQGNISPKGEILVKDEEDNVTGTKMTEGLKSALDTWASSQTATASAESNGSESLAFTGLPYGYYVMTTTHKDGDTSKAAITVTSTKPNASIYDKNENEPTAKKEVEQASYSIGDTVKYTAEFGTTNYMGKGSNAKQVVDYVISDTLPNYLSNVTVTKITIGGADYKVDGSYPQFDSNKQIVIPWANKDTSVTPAKFTSIYDQGAKILIEYEAKLTSVTNINKVDKNRVSILPEVDDDKGDKEPWDKTWEDTAEIITYAAALKKVDETGAVLDGAKFTIAGLELEKTADGIYTVKSYNASSDTPSMEITTKDGMLYIVGLASDVDLVVTETEAPAGYNKLTETKTLEPQVLSKQIWKLSGYEKYDADGNLVEHKETETTDYTQVTANLSELNAGALVIENNKGTELPSTGGIGTTIFYILGGLLVIGAAVVLVARRKAHD